MQTKISQQTKQELLKALRERYGQASRIEKGKILDEFVAIAECHRKHAIRLLTSDDPIESNPSASGRRIYSEAVREALRRLVGSGGPHLRQTPEDDPPQPARRPWNSTST